MADTEQLIQKLSAGATPVTPVRPRTHVARLLAGLLLYLVTVQWLLGVRPDIGVQLGRPFFVGELALLVTLMVTAVTGAVYGMYPDKQQKHSVLSVPYGVAALLLVFMLIQLGMPMDPAMVMPDPHAHTVECTIYIGVAALIPAALLFAYIRKGASVVPLRSGALVVLAASAIGAFTLRLFEAIDLPSHHLLWHYVPNLFFALIGALLGRKLLRW